MPAGGGPPPPLLPDNPIEHMREALIRLGLTAVTVTEFTNNGITTLNHLRMLTEDDLGRLIKQIHRDNQQFIHAVRFWANRMYILGQPFEIQAVTELLAETWAEIMKVEKEAATAPTDLIKVPEQFKKDTKWKVWKESVTTYLHSKKGQA